MRKPLALALFLVVLIPVAVVPSDKTVLPDKYRKWLDEEVVYIITARERDVFLQLKTDKERDIFIEAFWKHRDPSPGTERNEFREEHERRLQYANTVYGRSSPFPGWKTDRGRIYIILGPPKNIETYDQVTDVYPVEIWFYLGDPALGLPTGFNVIFFKKEGLGDYILYSPLAHGPQSLIADAMGNFKDERSAYQALMKLEPNLARQTLSLLPDEHIGPNSLSLASDKLIASIYNSPTKRVEDSYAEALLRYKDFVEVEYTANYIASESCVQVIRDEAGGFSVHYSVEPGKISVEDAGGKYALRFRLTGRVSDAAGRTIYQFDKDFPFTLGPDELRDIRAKSIAIQDRFPLVPGDYTFDLLLKNSISKEFAGATSKIVVPGEQSAPDLSPILLGYADEKKPGPVGERIPFKVGEDQILCASRRTFGAKERLVIFFQAYGLSEGLKTGGRFLTDFLKDDRTFVSTTRKVSECPALPSVIEVENLETFGPGYYQVRVSLLDAGGRLIAARKENFEVSYLAEIPRPFVVSKVATSFRAEDDLFAAGLQYFNKGDLAAAKRCLAGAYNRNPRVLEFALAYGQLLFRQNDFQAARAVLLPFTATPEPPADFLALLGRTDHALGRFEEALSYYKSYLARFGLNVDILNNAGTCSYRLGNKDEALKAWTKSLELSPNQDGIRKLVESLRK